jgi:hypothetical protein
MYNMNVINPAYGSKEHFFGALYRKQWNNIDAPTSFTFRDMPQQANVGLGFHYFR